MFALPTLHNHIGISAMLDDVSGPNGWNTSGTDSLISPE